MHGELRAMSSVLHRASAPALFTVILAWKGAILAVPSGALHAAAGPWSWLSQGGAA